MRTVPDHIGRPDYAAHPEGFPASEEQYVGQRLTQLTDEEQEDLRVAGE